jgi:GTP-binding protein
MAAPDQKLAFPADAIEAARKLFQSEAEFLWEAKSLDNLPPADLPEIAFAGRSNVGKSSLINALLGRKDLARASNTPGRTQSLVFFDLGDRLRIVDLPGYGYARASKTKISDWNQLTKNFLRGRAKLVRLCLLVDGRHGLKPSDHEMMSMLDDAALSYQVILTKRDKLKDGLADRVLDATSAEAAKRRAAHPVVLVTSADKGHGLPELRTHLAQFAEERGAANG